MLIPFRSRFHSLRRENFAWESYFSSSGEWEDIHEYVFWNDIKNIIWKKSTSNTLYEKTFSERSGISLVIFSIDEDGDDFSFSETDISKKKWKLSAQKILFANARKQKIPCTIYENMTISEMVKRVIDQKVQKKLICILASRLSNDDVGQIKKISSMNEIIFLRVHHVFELFPQDNELFFGKIFSKKYYKEYNEKFEKEQETIKKMICEVGAREIVFDISASIEQKLIYFFKYQYEFRR